MQERHNQILEYIIEHGKTEVSFLADYLHVSKVTLRKDLELLEERGMLKRERGYALPADQGRMNFNIASHYSKKLRIARTAVQYVQDNETVFIESGSTCALLAEEIAKRRHNVTIITNSLYLANFTRDYSNIQLILTGGTLQPQTNSMAGPITKETARFFHVEKFFTGTDGYSREYGFTGDDLTRADTLRAMIASADHTYVLTTSEKFSCPGAVSFLKFHEVYEVVTDGDIPEAEKNFLEQQGIIVTTT